MTMRWIPLGVALVTCWAILGAVDVATWAWSGYTANHRNIVLEVAPGGPADAAGVLPGDHVLAIDGRDTRRPGDLQDLGAASVGETRTLQVKRSGEEFQLSLAYGEMPRVEKLRAWLRIATGMAVMTISFLAWRRQNSVMTRWLALGGIGFALALLPGSWFDSGALRFAASLLRSALVLAAAVAALQFISLLPPAGNAKRPLARTWVWLPAGLLWLMLGLRALLPGNGWINTASLVVVGLVLSAYLLAATIRFLRNYIRSSATERNRYGLRWMFWCSSLGLLPGLVGGFTLLGQWPPAHYFFITAVLIPVGWANAALKAGQSGGA